MRTNRVLSVLLLVVVMVVFAPVTLAERVPDQQDPNPPGGTPGVNTCVTQSCALCGRECHPVLGEPCWDKCFYVAENGSCSCLFTNGACAGNGTCTYVP